MILKKYNEFRPEREVEKQLNLTYKTAMGN